MRYWWHQIEHVLCREDLHTWAQDQRLLWCEYYCCYCCYYCCHSEKLLLSLWTRIVSMCIFVFAKFQGGNGSSPVRGLPSARRSPQNSHSGPGLIVSGILMSYTGTSYDLFAHEVRLCILLLGLKIPCVCRSGRIAPLPPVCVLGNPIPKPPPANLSR